MRRLLLTVATAATALAGTACSDSTGLGSNVAGTYELRTINGQFLPVADGAVTIVAGQLELDNNGEFVDIIQFRTSGSSLIQTDESFGTWERSGNEIELFYDSGGRFFATRTSTNRLVVEDNNGNEWAYQRF